MTRYLKHIDIDKAKWDACIKNARNGLIYANSWYLDIAAPGWDALVKDNYSEVFPVPHRTKFGLRYVYPPFFIQQLGLFSDKKITEKGVNEFTSALSERFSFIEYYLNVDNNFDIKNFESTQNITYHLALNRTYNSIYNHYSDNLKRNIKKASNAKFDITYSIPPYDLIELFIANRGSSIKKIKASDYSSLVKLLDKAKQQNALITIGAIKNNKLCGGALFLKSNHSLIMIFSATNSTAKNIGVMPYLVDQVIKEYSETNTILDFEGSNDLNLGRFYKGFGSEKKTYLLIRKNNLPLPIKWIKKASR